MNLNHVLAWLTFTSCIFRVQVKIPWAIVQPIFRLGAFGFLQGFRQGCANSDCANETISIVENAGLMGVPIPAAITKAIDILKQKAEEERQEEG